MQKPNSLEWDRSARARQTFISSLFLLPPHLHIPRCQMSTVACMIDIEFFELIVSSGEKQRKAHIRTMFLCSPIVVGTARMRMPSEEFHDACSSEVLDYSRWTDSTFSCCWAADPLSAVLASLFLVRAELMSRTTKIRSRHD